MTERARWRVYAVAVAVAVLALGPGQQTGLGASGLVAQETDPRLLEVDDLFALRSVGSPRVSPEGDWVAYTVTTTSLEDETSETRVWMAPFDGGEPLAMTGEGTSASSPAWSPDGRYLSFTTARDEEKSQVWVLDRRGGEARALTDVEQGVGSYAWSPDGTRLALILRDPEEERDEDATQPPWVIDRLQFKRDGRGYLDRRRNHLYVFEGETGDLQRLTRGDFDHSSPTWSPDGRSIAFVSNRTDEPDANDNTDIWVLPADGDTTATPRRVTTNPAYDRGRAGVDLVRHDPSGGGAGRGRRRDGPDP
jgi:dipeptidyl aminopeptidase/acylaminoacyl peptidase